MATRLRPARLRETLLDSAAASTLARLAVDAGLEVVLSNSRGPQTLPHLVDELGPHARAGTPAQAAAAGDWVVVTIPVGAIGTVPRELLVDRTVIDTGSYFAPRDGTVPELETHTNSPPPATAKAASSCV